MSKGLGRGLSSLIPPKTNSLQVQAEVQASAPELQRASTTTIVDIHLDQLDPNPMQPRQHFDPTHIEELKQSIATYGLLEPIVVTPIEGRTDRWHIVAGERRFRACQALGRETIPAIIRSTTELERLELALIENIQRQDLNPMEKAYSLSKLVDDFGITQELAAQKLGMARSTLANTIRLLDLPAEIQQGLSAGKISEGHAKVLLSLETDQERLQLYTQMTKGNAMSVRDLSDAVGKRLKKSSAKRRVVDYELQSIEDRLQKVLGTKVTIKKKSSGIKQIIIDTYSDEEFKSVLTTLEVR